MDWALAIARNRAPLLRIVAELFALAGALSAESLPRAVHRAVLAVLRPAESAVRRLIIVAAHGLVVKLPPPRPLAKPITRSGSSPRPPRFQLFDSRKRFAANRRRYLKPGQGPRITFFTPDDDPRVPLFRPPVPLFTTIEVSPARAPSDTVAAESLRRRLIAIKDALDDIPKQAHRLARWRARRARMTEAKFRDPCRPGRPPGQRARPSREIDHIVKECHWLAWERERINSS